MTTPPERSKSRAPKAGPRAAAAANWTAIEAATEAWRGLRITHEDLDRVAVFLQTQRARQLHGGLVEIQTTLQRELRSLDWTQFDPAVLLGLRVISEHLLAARDHGFPAGTENRPVERWLVLLYRLLLAAEDAHLPVLSLAQRAMVAMLGRDGAWGEFVRRARVHSGLDAAIVPLLEQIGQDNLAATALQQVRRTVAGKVRDQRDRLGRDEAREEIDNAIGLEIARRLGQESDRAMAAVLEALPAGHRASRWDYLARDAATRLRREARRRLPSGLGSEEVEPATEPADRDTPDQVAALREIFRRKPHLLATLRASVGSPDRATAARRLGRSTRTVQRHLDELRRELEDLLSLA